MASRQGTGTDMNGVALDERSKPSLESLVLHYAQLDPKLFSSEAVRLILGNLQLTEDLVTGDHGPKSSHLYRLASQSADRIGTHLS